MTESAVVFTSASDPEQAARELCAQLHASLPKGPLDAVVLFASPAYDQAALLRAVHERCRPRVLVGRLLGG